MTGEFGSASFSTLSIDFAALDRSTAPFRPFVLRLGNARSPRLTATYGERSNGRMKRLLPALLAAALVVSACGEESDEPGGDGAASGSARDAAASAESEPPAGKEAAEKEAAEREPAAGRARRNRGPLVKLRDSQLGPVLFSGSDRAAYFFTREGDGKPRCYGECAAAWPPFLAKGRPRAGEGVRRSLLGTTERRNGTRQITYKGQPLYFYVNDPRTQVLCNDIVEFGGTWFALDAQGNAPA